MGVNDQQKFCKVTVHRSDLRKPWERPANARGVRSTIAYKQLTPDPKPVAKDELARWTATGAAAVDGLDMPTRRRAHTTATMGSAMNPLSRMAMRFEQETAQTNEEPAALDALDLTIRNDSFLHCDTDAVDPVRQTFDEEIKMFVPGTPPIPSGLSVDMLPTADFTPEIPSELRRALDNDLNVEMFDIPMDDANAVPMSPRESRIRISTPGKDSSLFGDEMPTPLLSSSIGTPLEDHIAPEPTEEFKHFHPSPEPEYHQYHQDEQPVEEASFFPASSLEDSRLSDYQPEPQAEPLPQQEEEEEQLVDDEAEGVSSFIEVDSEDEDEDEVAEVRESAFDVCDNFDAILGEPLPNRGSRWRFSIGQKKSFVRQKRGMSSPPRMVGVPPPPSLARHMSVPLAQTPPHQTQASIRPKPIVHAPAGTPLYHGQMLHLAFKSSAGNTVQVSTQQRRSKSSVFSKLIECFSSDEPFPDAEDALRIIAHTSDGDIRGGDRISLARGDGSVLRIQKLSKKLSFSPKIDMKAKFVVCGVPEGTVVTDTTKFYLQSVYDRTKTIGFLKDRRHPGHGCLVMYAYRTTDDKSEPIQFFKRAEPPSFAQMHAIQQGHVLPQMSPLSPVVGGFM